MLKVVDVDFIKDYTLRVAFNNGEIKNVDLQNYLTGEFFANY